MFKIIGDDIYFDGVHVGVLFDIPIVWSTLRGEVERRLCADVKDNANFNPSKTITCDNCGEELIVEFEE